MTIEVGDWLSQPGTGPLPPCGLFKEGKDAIPVPLRRRDVSATVYASASFADTKETLSYVSDVECSAVFRFPLPPRAAVYRFRAVFGDREVVTKVKARAEAREEFDLAVAQGHSAVHMAQHEKGASVFEVSLGNLEAHTEVVVEFSYLRLLDAFGGTLEWSHTATWVPPYVGSAGDTKAGVDKVVSSLPTFAAKVSYSLSYDITVLAEAGTVRAIESPEPVSVERPAAGAGPAEGGKSEEAWRVRLSESVADPSKDLTLAVEMEPRAARRSSLRVQRTPAARGGEQRTVALATFVPPLPASASASASAAAGGAMQPLRKEIWFVVDCSGSMGGSPITQAREAALFFVRDLPVDSGVRFNMTVFGSSYTSLYKQCKPYDSSTEREAVSWIQNKVDANMGGTEILGTLQHIYSSPITAGYTREIIFLTDGGISGHEEQAVYELVNHKASTATADAKRTHVLCLGIGHGVHRGLLDGMASRSEGAAVYVVDDEAIASKTSFLKKAATAQGAALRPRLLARGALVRAAPHVLPQRLFAGEPLHVLLEVVSAEADATLELTAEYGSGSGGDEGAEYAPLTLSLPLGAALAAGGVAAAEEGEALPVLHAMAYIGGLMAGTSPLHVRADGSPLASAPSADTIKEAVVRLAVAEHLVTPHTSAVGVSLRRDPADPKAATNVVEVPLQLPHGRKLWGTDGNAAPQAASFACFGGSAGGQPHRMLMARRCAMPMPQACAMAAPMMMSCAAAAPPSPQQQQMAAPGGGHGRGGGGGAYGSARNSGCDGGGVREEMACGVADFSTTCDTLMNDSVAESFRSKGKARKKSSAGPVGAAFSNIRSALFGRSAPTAPAATAAACPPPPPPAPPAAYAEAAVMRQPTASADDEDEAEDEAAPESMDLSMEEVQPSPPAVSSSVALSGSELLAWLNLNRTTAGFWKAGAELARALGVTEAELTGGAEGGVSPVVALRPAGLSDDGWATVVVLAVLRRSLSGQREVWADMEAKALTWLGGVWPQGARSVGSTVLAAAKALAV